MKKLFFALCVCAGLYACTSDDDLVSSSSNATGSEAAAFITVNLKDVGSSTRATSPEDNPYAYGSEAEHAVASADFYFYGSSGNYMAKGNVASSTDINGSDGDGTNANVEWESNTVVAVYGLDGDHLPTMMLTVLNQPADIDLSNKTLEQATATLAGTPYGNSDGTFIMSTSVYEDGSSSSVVSTTALTEDDFATEPTATATDYPNGGVDVYVERLAAKVQVDLASTLETPILISSITDDIESDSLKNGIYVQLLGWDVNGTARDAYLVKQADAWTNGSIGGWQSGYNSATDHRCFWAYSPNYGVAHDYPTTSIRSGQTVGNTDADEESEATWLDDYLKYTSLNTPISFGSDYSTYCGENTNTAAILDSISNTGITNVLVKAQAGTMDEGTFTPHDIVEFHELYYTAADFCQKTVDDVVAYDFTTVVEEVIEALKKSDALSSVSSYLDDLNEAIIKDHIYKSASAEGGKHVFSTLQGADTDTAPSSVSPFGGEMLSLYNIGDGNVDIFYRDAQPYWGENGDGQAVGSEIIAKYPDTDLVYGGEKMGDYDFWFHVDNTAISALERLGLSALGLLFNITNEETGEKEYFMPIDNGVSFNTLATGDDPSFSGGHVYTTRNFLLRTITVEADGIDSEFGSHYPNFYNNGLMYYHVPIEHLNNTKPEEGSTPEMNEANYGIVRNHWYDITINSVSTIGRGIADPEEVIIPQPEIPYYYAAANINILSWKMVNQSVAW